MAKRQRYIAAADKLAAYQQREANHNRLAMLLRQSGVTVYNETAYQSSDVMLKATELETFASSKLERSGELGNIVNVENSQRGTFATLELGNGTELEHCYIAASAYTSGERLNGNGTLGKLKRGEVSTELNTLHELGKLIVFNPSIVPLTLERSSSVVSLNASIAYQRGKLRYMLHNVRVHIDAALSIAAMLDGNAASVERKLNKREAQAFKALERFDSELDASAK